MDKGTVLWLIAGSFVFGLYFLGLYADNRENLKKRSRKIATRWPLYALIGLAVSSFVAALLQSQSEGYLVGALCLGYCHWLTMEA